LCAHYSLIKWFRNGYYGDQWHKNNFTALDSQNLEDTLTYPILMNVSIKKRNAMTFRKVYG